MCCAYHITHSKHIGNETRNSPLGSRTYNNLKYLRLQTFCYFLILCHQQQGAVVPFFKPKKKNGKKRKQRVGGINCQHDALEFTTPLRYETSVNIIWWNCVSQCVCVCVCVLHFRLLSLLDRMCTLLYCATMKPFMAPIEMMWCGDIHFIW